MKNATEVVTELYRKFPKVEFIDERDLGEDIVGLMFEYRNTEVDEEQLKAYLDSIGNWYRIRESREFYGGKSLLVKAEDDYVSLPVEDDLGVDWYYKHRDDYDPYGEPKPDYLLGEAVEGERAFMLRKGVLPDGTDSMLFIVTPSNRLCIVNGKEGMNDPTNTEPLYMQGEKATIGGWEEELDKDTIVSLYLHQDGIVLDDADEEIDTEEDPEEGRFKKIASKSVLDSDGFYTDYTWYFDKEEGKHVFVFGDNEIYFPEDEYYDWEVEGDDEQAQAEAQEWFDSYDGEDRYDEGLKESLIDDIHTDFNIARKNWKKLGFSIPFDDALTIWQNKSKLAEPKWITKPIYDPDAWEDMVRMFRESQGGSKNESLKESYRLTKDGKQRVSDYISELKAKRKEILDAGKDTADETELPTEQDIVADLEFMGLDFDDRDGAYYCNGWGVTDNYESDYPLLLKLGRDFEEVADESLKESSSELPEKANLKKILDRFNSNGKSAKQGSWSIAKGGYDLDFQVSYKGEPIIDCVDGELHINKKEYEGGSTKEVAKIISSTYKDTSLKENVSDSESDWAMDNELKKTKLKTIDDDSPVYKSKAGKYFSLGSDDKYSGTFPEYCYDSEDPASCDKQFKSGMWTNKRKFDKASGKYVKEDYCDMFGCESGFFTRDDLNELMYEINDRCPKGMQATAIYMGDDQKTLEVDMEDDEYGSETVYKKIDMRKIRKPSDLLRYANSIIADFQNTVGKWEVGNEE